MGVALGHARSEDGLQAEHLFIHHVIELDHRVPANHVAPRHETDIERFTSD
jgi:hypothetical protein